MNMREKIIKRTVQCCIMHHRHSCTDTQTVFICVLEVAGVGLVKFCAFFGMLSCLGTVRFMVSFCVFGVFSLICLEI